MRQPTISLIKLAIVLLYWGAFVIAVDTPWFTKDGNAHYQSLADGFLAGKLSLTIEPDPRLAELENPWGGYQGIPRVHDATYYNGRYYLYFGVTPAVIAFAPFRALTGWHVSNAVVTALFVTFGFLAWARTWVSFGGTPGIALPRRWMVLGLAVLGLGCFTPALIGSTTFYSVPIACAYAFSGAMVMLAWKVFRGEGGAGCGTLVALSTCGGLLVGSRPNWVFAAVAVVAFVTMVWIRNRGERPSCTGKAVVAAASPMALIGIMLAWYNLARFGSPFEFGVRHQFAAVDQRFITLWDPSLIVSHGLGYLLEGPARSQYWPFVRLNGNAIGLIPWAPVVVVGAVGALVWVFQRSLRPGSKAPLQLGLLALSVFLVNVVSLSGVAFQNDRYSLDLIPGIVFASLVATSVARERLSGRPHARWVLMASWIVTSMVTVFQSVTLASAGWNFGEKYPAVVRALNLPSATVERLRGVNFGPVELQLTLKAAPEGHVDSLVSTKAGRNSLEIRHLAGGRAEFCFQHEGWPTVTSEPFAVEPGRARIAKIEAGFLYPDGLHPAFSSWSPEDIARARRTLRVWLDGKLLLDRDVVFYPVDPADLVIGPVPRGTGPGTPSVIVAKRFQGVGDGPSPTLRSLPPGWYRIRMTLPLLHHDISEPLLALGDPFAGNLFYIRYQGTDGVRLGHSVKEYGLRESQRLPVIPGQSAEVEIGIAEAEQTFPAQRVQSRVTIRFDGRVVLDGPSEIWPFDSRTIGAGMNTVRFGHCEPVFTGSRFEVERIDPRPAPLARPTGVFRVLLRPDPARIGHTEPLVTRGRSGAANCLGVTLVDRETLRFIHDNWGAGGTLSEPVRVQAGEPVEIIVVSGMLVPGQEAANEGAFPAGLIQVFVNGALAWETRASFHPATEEQVETLANSVGITSASPQFGSEVIEAGFVPLDAAPGQ